MVRKNAEDALVRSQQALAEAQRIAHLGSWELDLATDSMAWSDELCRLYGYAPRLPPTFDDFFGRFHPDDAESSRTSSASAVSARSSFDVDHRIVLPDGTDRWMRSQGRVERLGAGALCACAARPRTSPSRSRPRTPSAHQALHDPLTGLPNRTLLLDRLAHALGAARPDLDTRSALLFIDIDRFKVVNDSLGHPAGDQMLLAMAERPRRASCGRATRWPASAATSSSSCARTSHGEVDALGMADRIGEAMAQPLSWGDGELVVTVSTGIALASSPLGLGRDAAARRRRRHVPSQGGRPGPQRRVRRGHASEGRSAASTPRWPSAGPSPTASSRLHYQPIVELPSRRIVGFEALVRWQPPHPRAARARPVHPDRRGDRPHRAARRLGAPRRSRPGRARGSSAPGCAALTHGRQPLGRADQPARSRRHGRRRPRRVRPPARHASSSRSPRASSWTTRRPRCTILEALKELGVGLSIDDFGTGYSSLSYLKRFPVDVLKIDQSFVDGLGDDPEDSAIVNAIVSLAAR